MDIVLQLLLVKSKLQSIKTRIRLTREDLEEKKPNATAFIKGANEVELDLTEIEKTIYDLENEMRMIGREMNYAMLINGTLKEKINDLENEIKFKNIDL
jgi:predicted  nucleic acid-binding Zn-ribbon protein